MHRMKFKFEMKMKNKSQTNSCDLFKPRPKYKPNPDRLTDNGTLDTFLHRIRLEILDKAKHKQNKADNLTRKERQALTQPIFKTNILS